MSDYRRGGPSRGGGRGDRGGRGGYSGGDRGRGRGGSSGGFGEKLNQKFLSKDNVNWEVEKLGGDVPIHAQYVPRPSKLTSNHGKIIPLMTNHFQFFVKNSVTIHHYDLIYRYFGTQERPEQRPNDKKKLNRMESFKLFDAFLSKFGRNLFPSPFCVAFDGNKSVYSAVCPEDLKQAFRLDDVDLDGRKHRFELKFKKANEIDLSLINAYYNGSIKLFPKEAIQALEVIMKFPTRSALVSIGKFALFPITGERKSLTCGLELALGHRKSLRVSEVGLTIIFDRAATAFHKHLPAPQYLMEVLEMDQDLGSFRPNAYQLEMAKKAFANVKVVTEHLGHTRAYKIKDITRCSANKDYFNWKEGDEDRGEVTVADYFQQKYNITLRYPHLFCLVAFNNSKIPMELCKIAENQHPTSTLHRLNPNQQALMIKHTATSPDERFSRLFESHERITGTCSRILDNFGVQIDAKPLGVQAVVLHPPSLVFHNKMSVLPKDGKWDLRGKSFISTVSFEKFGLINFAAVKDEAMNFLDEFKAEARRMNMLRGNNEPMIRNLASLIPSGRESPNYKLIGEEVEKTLKQFKDSKCSFALCFFPADKNVYNVTKRVADTKLYFVTQGVALQNVKKGGAQLIDNILAKINKKLGGSNVVLNPNSKTELLKTKLMIIGADVTHPGVADELISSVAASVSTYNKDFTKFFPSIRVQPKKNENKSVQEMIIDFASMVEDHLINFKTVNNFLPESILYFRDGVSDGQHQQIYDCEAKYLMNPLKDQPTYKPKVTVCIISKRVHTRARPLDPAHGVGRHNNVPPGTTIDNVITHPSEYDYFQYGHEGIQGTSRPARYFVLHDDHKLNEGELEKTSFYLCHLFERCTRSISVPAPVMHAHNIAYRARQWIVSLGVKVDMRAYQTEEERYQAECSIAARHNEKVKGLDKDFLRQSMFFV